MYLFSFILSYFTHNGFSILIGIFLKTGLDFSFALLSSYEAIELLFRKALRDYLVQHFH